MKSIRKNLNLTLVSLSLYYSDGISITGLLKLKSMPRLKIVLLQAKNEKDEDFLKHHLAPFKELIIFRVDPTPDSDPEGLVSNPAWGLNFFSFDAVILYIIHGTYCLSLTLFGIQFLKTLLTHFTHQIKP